MLFTSLRFKMHFKEMWNKFKVYLMTNFFFI